MARVERFTSQEQIPVKQAQLIDPSGFRLDTSSAEALEIAGETASTIAQKLEDERKVKEELAERKRDAQDRIGITNVNAIMDDAVREYQRQIIGKPLPEHAAIFAKIEADARARAIQQDLTPEAREIANTNTDIKMERFADEAELANVIATNKDALIRTSEAYETALIEGNVNDIDDALELLAAQLKNLPPAEAAKYKAELEEQAAKEIEKNVLKSAMDKVSLNPASSIEAIDKELKSRKAGKKPSGEFALISDTELQSVKKYAKTLIEKAKTDSEIALNQAIVDAYSQIRDGATDIDAIIDKNDADLTQTAEDKATFAEKIPTYFNKINSTKTAEESNELIYDRLTQMTEAVERGAMSPAALEEQFANLKEFLTREDARIIRSKDIVATKTMQNSAFLTATDSVSDSRAVLGGVTENEMARMKSAMENAQLLKDLPRINFFNLALKKNQALRWNFGVYRKKLRSVMNQNPEWSQSQIFTASEVLLENFDKPEAEIIRAFDGANPNRAITKTPPSIEFEDIWPDLSPEEKAIIWSERMAGTPVSVILGELEE